MKNKVLEVENLRNKRNLTVGAACTKAGIALSSYYALKKKNDPTVEVYTSDDNASARAPKRTYNKRTKPNNIYIIGPLSIEDVRNVLWHE